MVLVVNNLVISFPTLLMPAFLALRLCSLLATYQGERVVLVVNNPGEVTPSSSPLDTMPPFLYVSQGERVVLTVDNLVISLLTLLMRAFLPRACIPMLVRVSTC